MKTRKLLAVLLSVMMVMSCFSFTVGATDAADEQEVIAVEVENEAEEGAEAEEVPVEEEAEAEEEISEDEELDEEVVLAEAEEVAGEESDAEIELLSEEDYAELLGAEDWYVLRTALGKNLYASCNSSKLDLAYKTDIETGYRYLHVVPKSYEVTTDLTAAVGYFDCHGLSKVYVDENHSVTFKALIRTNIDINPYMQVYNAYAYSLDEGGNKVTDESGNVVYTNVSGTGTGNNTPMGAYTNDGQWYVLTYTKTMVDEKIEYFTQIHFQLLGSYHSAVSSGFYTGNYLNEDGTTNAYVDIAAWGFVKNENATENDIRNEATITKTVVTFDPHNGEATSAFEGYPANYIEGTVIEFPENPTWEGHTFLGWSTALHGATVDTTAIPVPEAAVTYYAVWELDEEAQTVEDETAVYISSAGCDTCNNGRSAKFPFRSLKKANTVLDASSTINTIYVVGTWDSTETAALKIGDADKKTYLLGYQSEEYGAPYFNGSTGKLLCLKGDFEIDNLKMSQQNTHDGKFVTCGNDLVIGENFVSQNEGVTNGSQISLEYYNYGSSSNKQIDDTIIVNAGTFGRLYLNAMTDGTHYGKRHITIDGTTAVTNLGTGHGSGSSVQAFYGEAYVDINGGTVTNVNWAASSTSSIHDGLRYVTFNGGTTGTVYTRPNATDDTITGYSVYEINSGATITNALSAGKGDDGENVIVIFNDGATVKTVNDANAVVLKVTGANIKADITATPTQTYNSTDKTYSYTCEEVFNGYTYTVTNALYDTVTITNAAGEVTTLDVEESGIITPEEYTFTSGVNTVVFSKSILTEVYVDQTNGSDENDGKTAETAVATIAKALEYLNSEGGTIYFVGDYNVTETLAVAGKSIVYAGYGETKPNLTVGKQMWKYGGTVKFSNLIYSTTSESEGALQLGKAHAEFDETVNFAGNIASKTYGMIVENYNDCGDMSNTDTVLNLNAGKVYRLILGVGYSASVTGKITANIGRNASFDQVGIYHGAGGTLKADWLVNFDGKGRLVGIAPIAANTSKSTLSGRYIMKIGENANIEQLYTVSGGADETSRDGMVSVYEINGGTIGTIGITAYDTEGKRIGNSYTTDTDANYETRTIILNANKDLEIGDTLAYTVIPTGATMQAATTFDSAAYTATLDGYTYTLEDEAYDIVTINDGTPIELSALTDGIIPLSNFVKGTNTVVFSTRTDAPTPTQYTVTYVSDKGEVPVAVTVDEGTEITLATMADVEGFTFGGWTIGETTYAAGATYTVNADVTANAVWNVVIPEYTVTYVSEKGTAPEAVTVDEGTQINLATMADVEGFTFGGWKIGDETYAADATYTVNADVTANAVWNEIVSVPTVVYVSSTGDDANDGLTKETAKRTLKSAVALAGNDHDTVVLVVDDTSETAGNMDNNTTLAVGNLTITSKWGDEDYTETAKLPLPNGYWNVSANQSNVSGLVTFENITIHVTDSQEWHFLNLNGFEVHWGEGVVIDSSKTGTYNLKVRMGGEQGAIDYDKFSGPIVVDSGVFGAFHLASKGEYVVNNINFVWNNSTTANINVGNDGGSVRATKEDGSFYNVADYENNNAAFADALATATNTTSAWGLTRGTTTSKDNSTGAVYVAFTLHGKLTGYTRLEINKPVNSIGMGNIAVNDADYAVIFNNGVAPVTPTINAQTEGKKKFIIKAGADYILHNTDEVGVFAVEKTPDANHLLVNGAEWTKADTLTLTESGTYALTTADYKVEFKQGETVLETDFLNANGTVEFNSTTPVDGTKTFLGWAVEGAEDVVDLATYEVTADTVFVPVFAENYTVTYVSEKGTAPEAVTVDEGTEITLAAMADVEGFTFGGWTIGETTYAAGTKYRVSTDITATAVWNKILDIYTVTWNNNDGVADNETTSTVTEGDDLVLPEANPVRTGYDFVGWATTVDAETADVTVETPITSDVEFFAVWTVSKITLTYTYGFNGEGFGSADAWVTKKPVDYGTTDDIVPLMSDSKKTNVTANNIPAHPYRNGYWFKGWSEDGVNVVDITAATESKTYTAIWEQTNILEQDTDYTLTVVATAEDSIIPEDATAYLVGTAAGQNFFTSTNGYTRNQGAKIAGLTAATSSSYFGGGTQTTTLGSANAIWYKWQDGSNVNVMPGVTGEYNIVFRIYANGNDAGTQNRSFWLKAGDVEGTVHLDNLSSDDSSKDRLISFKTTLSEDSIIAYSAARDFNDIEICGAQLLGVYIWREPARYTVTYATEKGEVPAAVTVIEGTQIEIETMADVEGFVFGGWKIGDEIYESGASYTVNASVTANAVWYEEGAVVANAVFDADGGTWADGDTTRTIATVVGEIPVAPTEEPTKPGFAFRGWTPELSAITEEGATYTATWIVDLSDKYPGAQIVYVSATGTGTADGSSADNAYKGIKEAMENFAGVTDKPVVYAIVDDITIEKSAYIVNGKGDIILTSAGGDLYLHGHINFEVAGAKSITFTDIDIYYGNGTTESQDELYISLKCPDLAKFEDTVRFIPNVNRTADFFINVGGDGGAFTKTKNVTFEYYATIGSNEKGDGRIVIRGGAYGGTSLNTGIDYIIGGNAKVHYLYGAGHAVGVKTEADKPSRTISGDITVTVKDNATINNLYAGNAAICAGDFTVKMEGGTVNRFYFGTADLNGSVGGGSALYMDGGTVKSVDAGRNATNRAVIINGNNPDVKAPDAFAGNLDVHTSSFTGAGDVGVNNGKLRLTSSAPTVRIIETLNEVVTEKIYAMADGREVIVKAEAETTLLEAEETEHTIEIDIPEGDYVIIFDAGEIVTYNITFDVNGGTWADGDTNATKTVSTEYGLVPTPPAATMTGHALSWDKELALATEDASYTAVWTPNNYDAVFDANSGAWADGDTIKTVSTTFGTQIVAPEAPEKKYYVFDGWTPEVGIMDSEEGKSFTANWKKDFGSNVVYISNDGDDTNDGLTAGTPIKTLVKADALFTANEALDTLVVISYSKNNEAKSGVDGFGVAGKKIYITGYTAESVFDMVYTDADSHIRFGGDVEFYDITVNGSGRDGGFMTQGYKFTYGDNVTSTGSQDISVVHYNNQYSNDSEINVNSGAVRRINLAVFSGQTYVGRSVININGGSVTNIYNGHNVNTVGGVYGIVDVNINSGTVGTINLGTSHDSGATNYAGVRYYTLNGGSVTGNIIATGSSVVKSGTSSTEDRSGVTVFEINKPGILGGAIKLGTNKQTGVLEADDATRVVIFNNGSYVEGKVEDEGAVVINAIGGTLKALTTEPYAAGSSNDAIKTWAKGVALTGFAYTTDTNLYNKIVVTPEGGTASEYVIEAAEGTIPAFTDAGTYTVEFVYDENYIMTTDVEVIVNFDARTDSSVTSANIATISVNGATPVAMETAGNTAKSLTHTLSELEVGKTYTIAVEKNGYVGGTCEITVARGENVLEMTLVGGDIKDSFEATHGNGVVDIDDFIRVIRGFDSIATDEHKAAVDINENGIDIADITTLKLNFGKTKAATAITFNGEIMTPVTGE